MKKIMLIIIMGVICLIPITANAIPKPRDFIQVYINQKPVDCVYVDLLVKIDSDNKHYVSFNSEYGNTLGLNENTEIAMYNKDGFISYTFHFSGAVSDNKINYETGLGYFAQFAYCIEQSDGSLLSTLSELKNVSPILKLALIDSEGRIIKVSAEFNIVPKKGTFLGYLDYAASTGFVEVSTMIYPSDYIFASVVFIFTLLFAGILRITFSIVSETLIALPFKLRPYWRIVVVNLITQIILTVAFALSDFKYILTLMVLEILVYIAEFVIYTILYKEFSKIKILIYTVLANTVSLGFGLLLNHLGIFK